MIYQWKCVSYQRRFNNNKKKYTNMKNVAISILFISTSDNTILYINTPHEKIYSLIISEIHYLLFTIKY